MPSYLELEVSLTGIRPRIWRRFLLPEQASLFELHEAIQSAFGWTGGHLWAFFTPGLHGYPITDVEDDWDDDDDWEVDDGTGGEDGDDEGDRERQAGGDVGNVIDFPLDPGLLPPEMWDKLRRIVASARPPETAKAADVPVLSYLRDPELYKSITYAYDFGDDWRHKVALKRVVELEETFQQRLLKGARACPPEDCGGVFAYEMLVEFLRTGKDPWTEIEEIEREEFGDEFADEEEDDEETKAERLESLRGWTEGWDPDHFDLKKTQAAFDC